VEKMKGAEQRDYTLRQLETYRGEFFEAHEAWEERWRTETDPNSRRFFQGLIQVAAAFHKLLLMNAPASASRLLGRGLAKLDASSNMDASAGLASVRAALRACEEAIANGSFDPSMIPAFEHPAGRGLGSGSSL
jgi:uncharacterized protein